MKKIFIILVFVLSNIAFLNAQNIEIPQTQNPVLIKITASWCPNCGSWGWSFFHDLIEDNDDKSVIFAAHASGNYKNTTSVDFVSNFNTIGQPRFLFNGEDQFVVSNSTSTKRNTFKTKVNETSSQTPIAQTGIDARYNNKTMTVNYTTKFFNSTSGDYYLGLYLIEKEVIGYQASQGNDAKHKKVLREELSGNSYGNLIVSGSVSTENTYDGIVEFDISKYDPKNLEIASIIWKKEGNKYKIINSNIDTEVSFKGTSNTANSDNQLVFSFDIFPTIIQNQATIELKLSKVISNPILMLYNFDGKIILKNRLEQLKIGSNLIQFQVPSNTPEGFYFAKIITQNGNSFTKKIIIANK